MKRSSSQRAEDLARLGLDLLFLAAADVRDDVVEDRVRRHARVAGAGDGLHRRDVELVDAEAALDRRDGHRQSDRRAVRIRDDVAVAAAAFFLPLDRAEVIGVDLGDQQRDVGVHAVIARVRDDDAAAIRVVVLGFAGDGGVESGEDEARFELARRAASLRARRPTSGGACRDASRRRRRTIVPALRSEATTSCRRNQGCASRSCTKRWPTEPVAPRTATGMRSDLRASARVGNVSVSVIQPHVLQKRF